jgi:hypothetical protein
MNENIAQEILHELFSAMEALETQSTAILQFLKDKGIGSEDELAAQMERAGEASNVRWRAVQVRIDYLLSSAMKAAEQEASKEPAKTAERAPESRNSVETTTTKETEQDTRDEQKKQKTDAAAKPEADGAGGTAETDPKTDNDPEGGGKTRTSQPAPKK